MAHTTFTPYTYIQCPCFDSTNHHHSHSHSSSGSESPTSEESHEEDEEEDNTFDPRSPRSRYSLFPLEYLLYCVDCYQIRCPRCVTEELVSIYCPSCLFEVGASSVKSEGNRCTRSCFQCPICVGPLAVQSAEPAPEPQLLTADNAAPTGPSGPWVLCCSYCNWSSAEIGLKFDKPQGISAQLSKLRNGQNHGHGEESSHYSSQEPGDEAELDSTKTRFSAMKKFYQSQLANTNSNSGLGGGIAEYGYGSPATLSRIMSLYSGNPLSSLKPKTKPSPMREADSPEEGLRISNLDETSTISTLRSAGYDGTITRSQADLQLEEGARFPSELWPIPYLLRTKRAKRCPACRHILSKPEAKVSNTRWRIRLVAGNYIPSIAIKPLLPPGTPVPTHWNPSLLKPLKPHQFLLTFKNPIFEKIKVTLATPATTPGRFASKVTVLCPQFTIDANSDDLSLDEVLKDGDRDHRQRSGTDASIQQPEAGKVWDRGRNWVSIVVEVIPSSLRIEPKPVILRKEGEVEDLSPLREDEDVLEIPMFVRLEWEAEPSQDAVGAGKDKDVKEKRELAYWCVLGVGRISQE